MLKHLSILILLLISTWSYGQTFALPDTNFRNCLKTLDQRMITTAGELDIAVAESRTGELKCSGSQIQSVVGIHHFTKATRIILNDNKLTSLPDLSTIKNLTYLDVSENQLSSLPDLKQLVRLKTIVGFRNKIKSFPDISKNDSLVNVNLHTNEIDTLPDLSNLKQLTYLALHYNHLKYLPNIDKLVSLRSLIAYKNFLVELPSLAPLNRLETLNIGYNDFTSTPILGSKTTLKEFFINDCRINKLTDFSQCVGLVNVRLYNNPLTFSELLKLTTVQGYDTLFKLNPQQPLKVGRKITVNQTEPLLLTTFLDKHVPNVTYEWYKNNTLIGRGRNDSLVIAKASLTDSGKYICRLKHPSFPSVILQTDTFKISVVPCLDLSTLSIQTTEISCLSSGSILLKGYNDSTNNAPLFEIKSVAGKQHISTNGIFNGLNETSYSLEIRIKGGCTKKYPTKIRLYQKECEEVLISPNDDGEADSHYFEETGKVTIYDKRGNVVKTMSIPGEWNGSSERGKVFSGFYVADINNGKKLVGITVLY